MIIMINYKSSVLQYKSFNIFEIVIAKRQTHLEKFWKLEFSTDFTISNILSVSTSFALSLNNLISNISLWRDLSPFTRTEWNSLIVVAIF